MKRNIRKRAERSDTARGLALLRTRRDTHPRSAKFLGFRSIADQARAVRLAAEADNVDLVQGVVLTDDEYSADLTIVEVIFQTARMHGLTKVYMVDRRCLCLSEADLTAVERYCTHLRDCGIDVVEAPIEEPL